MGFGAPLGNKNAAKAKLWEESIKRALARASGTVDKGLDDIADKIVAKATNGDLWAIQHIADRIDGRPKEHVQVDQTVEHVTTYGDYLAGKRASATPADPESTVQ